MQNIMIVEDDDNIREVVAEYLKKHDFIPLPVEDGDVAAAFIDKDFERFSLFILDIMLPGRSGSDLLKLIRERGDTPVIMLTALDDEYTQLSSFNEKADDYVTKPFSPKILIKRVEALLRRSGGGETLQISAISLDVGGYAAYENGVPLNLTLKELEILKTLMQSPRRVFSRQQLLDTVWGYDYFGDDRIIDVHIKNLRKKLETPLIATVKGVGYKIEPTGEQPPGGHV